MRQFAAESTKGFELWLRTDAAAWPRPEQFELLVSFCATLAEDLFRDGQLATAALDDEPPVPMRRVRDLERFLDRLALVQPSQPSATPAVERPRVGVGSASPWSFGPGARLAAKRNLLTFVPDGARGVAAMGDGEKAATA